jgi:uncharacterized protein (DUF3820 family)
VVLTAARLGTGRFVADAPARGLLWFVAVGWCNGLAALLMYAALAKGSVALISPWSPLNLLVTVVGTTLLFGKVEAGRSCAQCRAHSRGRRAADRGLGRAFTHAQRKSVSAEHERFERKHQSLEPKNERVHQAESIHGVKGHSFHGASLF